MTLKRMTLLLAVVGMMCMLLAAPAQADVIHVTEYGIGTMTADGSPTGSGEASSPDLPFGTVVEVCYDGCVTTTIHDRCFCGLDLWATDADAIGLPGGDDCDVEILYEP